MTIQRMIDLAECHFAAGSGEEAAALLEQALPLARGGPSPEHREETVRCLTQLTRVRVRLGRHAPALEAALEGLNTAGAGAAANASADGLLENLIRIRVAQGQLPEAEAAAAELRALREKLNGGSDYYTLAAVRELGNIRNARGHTDDAIRLWQTAAFDLKDDTLKFTLGGALLGQARYREALTALRSIDQGKLRPEATAEMSRMIRAAEEELAKEKTSVPSPDGASSPPNPAHGSPCMVPPDTRPRSSTRGFLRRPTLPKRGARAHPPRLLVACIPLFPGGLPAAGESLRYSFGYTSGSVQSRGGGVVFNETTPVYAAYPFRGNGGTYSADIPPRRRFAEGVGSLFLSTGSLSTKLYPEFMDYRSIVGNGGLTMELWIKGGGGSGCIMTVSGAFGFEATATGIRWVNGFYVPDGVAADLSREDWHHLAGVIENPTRSGTDMVGDLALYVDGVFRGRRKGTTWSRDSQTALTLGDHPVDYIKEPWTGQISMSPASFWERSRRRSSCVIRWRLRNPRP